MKSRALRPSGGKLAALLTAFFFVCASPCLAHEAASSRFGANVEINGAGPFHFVIDTGANRSGVSPDVAAALALPEEGEGVVHMMDGPRSMSFRRVAALETGGLALRDARLPVLDAPGVLGPADGVLGLDILGGQRVMIDLRSRAVRFAAPSRRAPGADWFAISLESGPHGLFLTDAVIDGVATRVVFDTGADSSIGNSALRRALRLGEASFGQIRAMQIGELEAQGLSMEFADTHAFRFLALEDRPAAVIGVDLFGRAGALAIDYRFSAAYVRLPGVARREAVTLIDLPLSSGPRR